MKNTTSVTMHASAWQCGGDSSLLPLSIFLQPPVHALHSRAVGAITAGFKIQLIIQCKLGMPDRAANMLDRYCLLNTLKGWAGEITAD